MPVIFKVVPMTIVWAEGADGEPRHPQKDVWKIEADLLDVEFDRKRDAEAVVKQLNAALEGVVV